MKLESFEWGCVEIRQNMDVFWKSTWDFLPRAKWSKTFRWNPFVEIKIADWKLQWNHEITERGSDLSVNFDRTIL